MAVIGIASSSNIADPRPFSGIPHGLAVGVRENDHEVVGVSAELPPRLATVLRLGAAATRLRPSDLGPSGFRHAVRRGTTRAISDPAARRARSARAARALAGVDRIDGCLQFGTDFSLPRSTPYVTYDDQTIAQAGRAFDYPWIQLLSDRERRRIIEEQRRVFSQAKVCCATTIWAAQSIIEDYGISPGKVRVVGIGANVSAQDAVPHDWELPRFLFVGKDWRRKNGDRVVQAFASVREVHPKAQLDVVGGHPALGEPGVVEHGLLDPKRDWRKLRSLYTAATCFVLPSLHEPSAIAYVEALSAGVGAIGTASGGAATLLGESGLIVDPIDTDQLTEAMLGFCDPAYASEHGALAQTRAQLFSWKRVSARLIAAVLDLPEPDTLA